MSTRKVIIRLEIETNAPLKELRKLRAWVLKAWKPNDLPYDCHVYRVQVKAIKKETA